MWPYWTEMDGCGLCGNVDAELLVVNNCTGVLKNFVMCVCCHSLQYFINLTIRHHHLLQILLYSNAFRCVMMLYSEVCQVSNNMNCLTEILYFQVVLHHLFFYLPLS